MSFAPSGSIRSRCDLAGGLDAAKRRRCDREYGVVSRQCLWVSPTLHSVTDHTRFAFVFAAAIGTPRQLFLAIFDPGWRRVQSSTHLRSR